MIPVIIIILFWILAVVSVMLIPLGLPGTFFIVFLVIILNLSLASVSISWGVVISLLLIAIGLEVVEYVLTAWSSRRYGASRTGAFSAITGSILGAIIGSAVFPIIGTLAGAFLGAFGGTFTVEYLRNSDLNAALKAGKGSFIGSVGGKLIKLSGAVAMLVIIGAHL